MASAEPMGADLPRGSPSQGYPSPMQSLGVNLKRVSFLKGKVVKYTAVGETQSTLSLAHTLSVVPRRRCWASTSTIP